MTNNRMAVFGLGSFGPVHLSDAAAQDLAGLAVDTQISPGKIETAEANGVVLSNTDVTDHVEVEREDGEVVDHEYSDMGSLRVDQTDAWDVVSPTDTHLPVAIAGLEAGKDLLLEKPPAETSQEIEYLLDEFPEAKAGVDYIEKEHPAVLAAVDAMDKAGEEPGYSFNWRSKDLRGNERGLGGGEGSRIILEDLVHDLSEIDSFRDKFADDLSTDTPDVSDAELTRWSGLEGDFPYSTDAEAGFGLEFDDGMTAEVRGSFADDERRYFVVTNQEGDYAVFANTLDREHISPVTAEVTGEKNVDTLLEYARQGKILDQETQSQVLQEADAETREDLMNRYVPDEKWIDGEPKYGWAPVYRMIQNFSESSSAEELTCSLEQAHAYQQIAEDVYSESGEPGAQQFEVLEG